MTGPREIAHVPGGTDVPGGDEPLPDGVAGLFGAYLGRQRWYAGSTQPAPDEIAVVSSRVLWASDDDGHRLWSVIVDGEGARYQVLVGQRPGGETADFLSGRDDALLGAVDSRYFYDATIDPEMARHLLEVVTGGREHAERVRPVSVEQSNTSLVYDDRVILKVFRRLAVGPNPDVVVTTALAAAGFAHVAPPVASWRADDIDLAFVQEFLVGGSEGWALALTSLRDLYNGDTDDPAEAGGDFAGEATRLGAMTARMHLAMAAAFPVEVDHLAGGAYDGLVDDIARRLEAIAGLLGDEAAAGIAPLVARLRAVDQPGPALRVHGDYHLGQVMRTDAGWFVLDFEGEPARPVAERTAPASPAKDITGMLRSFHYASRFALCERGDAEQEALRARAQAWEDHNRNAFMAGYLAVEGITDLLPGLLVVDVVDEDLDPAAEAEPALRPAVGIDPVVLAAYELDKALYELAYERSYRPDWVDIPIEAVARIVSAG